MEKILREKLINGQSDKVPLKRSKMMQAIKGKGNKSTELKFKLALAGEGISGWDSHAKLLGNPDIYFPIYKCIVFLDGCFWHGCPKCGHIPKTNYPYWKTKIERNKIRDLEKTLALQEQGFLVVRFWEHELNQDIKKCIEFVKDSLENELLKLVDQL